MCVCVCACVCVCVRVFVCVCGLVNNKYIDLTIFKDKRMIGADEILVETCLLSNNILLPIVNLNEKHHLLLKVTCFQNIFKIFKKQSISNIRRQPIPQSCRLQH